MPNASVCCLMMSLGAASTGCGEELRTADDQSASTVTFGVAPFGAVPAPAGQPQPQAGTDNQGAYGQGPAAGAMAGMGGVAAPDAGSPSLSTPQDAGTGHTVTPPPGMPGTDNPSANCGAQGYLLCEDFEATAVGDVPAGWQMRGDARVSEVSAFEGARALEIGAAVNGERRIVRDASVLGSSHWGRVYYRVQTPVPTVFVHSTLVALQGVGPTRGSGEYRVVDTVKQADGAHQFLYNVQPNGFEFGTGSSYDYHFDDQWHCAEWFIDGDNQAYQFYIDGVEVESIRKQNGPGNYSGTDIPASFSEVRVGWNNYQGASPGFVAFIDGVAMHHTRIGCSN